RRVRLDLPAQTMKTIANFVWLQDGYRLVESSGFQIKEQRHGDRLQIPNAIRSGHGRTCEHARAPWLPVQPFPKDRREFFQLIDILRITEKREGQLTCLFKIMIVDFQSLHG